MDELRFRQILSDYPWRWPIAFESLPVRYEKQLSNVLDWCSERYPFKEPYTWATDGYRTIYFSNEKDAIEFKMRWC